jgi:hypothetical protein
LLEGLQPQTAGKSTTVVLLQGKTYKKLCTFLTDTLQHLHMVKQKQYSNTLKATCSNSAHRSQQQEATLVRLGQISGRGCLKRCRSCLSLGKQPVNQCLLSLTGVAHLTNTRLTRESMRRCLTGFEAETCSSWCNLQTIRSDTRLTHPPSHQSGKLTG